MAKYLETFRGVAQPWLCDRLGHLNTRHYMAMFDESAQHFFLLLGHSSEEAVKTRVGWADVKHVVNYKSEVSMGSLVLVDCAVIRVGAKSFTYRQRLLNADTKEVCATNDATSVLLDLESHRALALPDALRTAAAEYQLSEEEIGE